MLVSLVKSVGGAFISRSRQDEKIIFRRLFSILLYNLHTYRLWALQWNHVRLKHLRFLPSLPRR